MAWRAITEKDLLTQISESELAGIRANAKKGTDPVGDSIALITESVRGYVAANPSNAIGPAGTLPERLIRDAVALLVPELYGRTAGLLIDLSEVRKTAAESAERKMRDVAGKRFAVEVPESGTATTEDAASAACSLVTKSAAPLRRDDLAGF